MNESPVSSDCASATPLTTFIEFQGIRGIQAGRPQYATVWSLGLLLRMVEESLTRGLAFGEEPSDSRFVIDLAARFAADDDDLVFDQPILLGIFGPIEFLPSPSEPILGAIRMDPTNRIEILDGLHRLAALHHAALPAARIAGLTVPVIISPIATAAEFGKRREAITSPVPAPKQAHPQLRLNNTIYREIAKDSIDLSPFLSRAIDLNTNTLSRRSGRLFTFTGYARACRPMLAGPLAESKPSAPERLAAYWQHLGDILTPWRRFAAKAAAASELRETSVLGTHRILTAFGLLGARLLAERPDDWPAQTAALADVDWRQDNPLWHGTIITDGRKQKGDEVVQAALRVLLDACGLGETDPGNATP